MLCTATPDISSSREIINSMARVSGLFFRFLCYVETKTLSPYLISLKWEQQNGFWNHVLFLSIHLQEVIITIEDIGNRKSTKRCICLIKKNNLFESLPIKMCDKRGNIVGHLPMEISRITKFLLDRGARIKATLKSTHYRRSPLVQGGLEIPCMAKVLMMPTQFGPSI